MKRALHESDAAGSRGQAGSEFGNNFSAHAHVTSNFVDRPGENKGL